LLCEALKKDRAGPPGRDCLADEARARKPEAPANSTPPQRREKHAPLTLRAARAKGRPGLNAAFE